MNFHGERPTEAKPSVDESISGAAIENAQRREFLRLVTPILPQARNLATRLLGNRYQAAEDIIQDSLIKAMLHFGDSVFPQEKAFYAWFAKIVTNTVFDYQKRQKRRDHAPLDALTDADLALTKNSEQEPTQSPEELALLVQQNERVRKAIENIRPERLDVFSLVYLEGLTYSEAAEHLGIPEGTVMSRLSRGRQDILQALSDKVPDVLKSEAEIRTRDAILQAKTRKYKSR